MADMKRFGNIPSGKKNKDGWRVYRQEARERLIAPAKFIGGVILLTIAMYSFMWFGFALPG